MTTSREWIFSLLSMPANQDRVKKFRMWRSWARHNTDLKVIRSGNTFALAEWKYGPDGFRWTVIDRLPEWMP